MYCNHGDVFSSPFQLDREFHQHHRMQFLKPSIRIKKCCECNPSLTCWCLNFSTGLFFCSNKTYLILRVVIMYFPPSRGEELLSWIQGRRIPWTEMWVMWTLFQTAIARFAPECLVERGSQWGRCHSALYSHKTALFATTPVTEITAHTVPPLCPFLPLLLFLWRLKTRLIDSRGRSRTV